MTLGDFEAANKAPLKLWTAATFRQDVGRVCVCVCACVCVCVRVYHVEIQELAESSDILLMYRRLWRCAPSIVDQYVNAPPQRLCGFFDCCSHLGLLYVCMYIHMCVCIYVCMYAFMHACMCMYVNTLICMYVCLRARARARHAYVRIRASTF
jgi:hypothetical protein